MQQQQTQNSAPEQAPAKDAAAPEAPQAKGQVKKVAAQGVENAQGQMPFLERLQQSFGHHSLGGVKAQVGGSAAVAAKAMGAGAYAQGEKVGFGADPDLFKAAHEAAHVLWQRYGKKVKDGVGDAGDEGEQFANRIAALVVAGAKVEEELDGLLESPPKQAEKKGLAQDGQRDEAAEAADSEPGQKGEAEDAKEATPTGAPAAGKDVEASKEKADFVPEQKASKTLKGENGDLLHPDLAPYIRTNLKDDAPVQMDGGMKPGGGVAFTDKSVTFKYSDSFEGPKFGNESSYVTGTGKGKIEGNCKVSWKQPNETEGPEIEAGGGGGKTTIGIKTPPISLWTAEAAKQGKEKQQADASFWDVESVELVPELGEELEGAKDSLSLAVGVEVKFKNQFKATGKVSLVKASAEAGKFDVSGPGLEVTGSSPVIEMKERDFLMVNGVQTRISGSITVDAGFSVEPNYQVIGREILKRHGPQVLRFFGTSIARIVAGVFSIPGLFIAGGALTLYCAYKSFQQISDLKALAPARDASYSSWRAGVMSGYGFEGYLGSDFEAWKEGLDIGSARWMKVVNEVQERLPFLNHLQIHHAMREELPNHENELFISTHDTSVQLQIAQKVYDAWYANASSSWFSSADTDAKYARARLGIPPEGKLT
ncbi:MAG: DUF4157 domain-containing protein [Myxococcota bacterium]|jgi:hypothetical protein|nr:DUF4157 domain-containing protein [Myxococcota bacterium]